MDPTTIMLWLAMLLPGQAGEQAVSIAPAPVSAESGDFVTIVGGLGGRRVEIWRKGKLLGTFDLKKIRANPALDPKLQPGDVLEFPESVF